jgi:BirA family transcriptional regulator, biotin operon repressor / biotin---[acetyl-CoA-carboxylase] ligase
MPGRFHPIIELETIGSTNIYAEQLLAARKVEDGTVILAREQTSGKGQGGNSWESEPGKNLTFSLVLCPDFLPPEMQFLLNKAIALGVLDCIQLLIPGFAATIKWPNDIYAGNGKIGGILISNIISGNLFSSCIAGIGLNINQEEFSTGAPGAVSLKQITGASYPLREALGTLLDCIDERYTQLRSDESGLLDLDYCRNLYGYGIWKDYLVNNALKKGRILDVDDSGKLILETGEGLLLYLQHGEIGFISP